MARWQALPRATIVTIASVSLLVPCPCREVNRDEPPPQQEVAKLLWVEALDTCGRSSSKPRVQRLCNTYGSGSPAGWGVLYCISQVCI